MAVISGKRAVMDGVGSLRNWKVSRTDDVQTPLASSTDGMPFAQSGNQDWTGTAEFYGHTPPYMPGDSFTFQGNPDTAGTKLWTGAALVRSINVIIDIEAASIISGTLTFEGNGALTNSTGTISDATSPAMYSAKALKGTWAGSDIAQLRRMEFTLECDLQRYASGGTSGTAGFFKRVAGNLRGNGQFTTYEATPDLVLAYGTIDVLRYYVTSTTYWSFSYALLASNDPNADVEGGTIPGQTYPWVYSGWKDITGTITQGSIVKPSTSAWWS